jgi:hypothetical protein
MAMIAGSVAVAPDGSYTGSDLAKALMDAHVTSAEALLAAQAQPLADAGFPGVTTDPKVKAAMRQQLAAMANAYATALVSYLRANAKAHVTVEVLARTPNLNPVPANADAQPPAAPVDIPIQ